MIVSDWIEVYPMSVPGDVVEADNETFGEYEREEHTRYHGLVEGTRSYCLRLRAAQSRGRRLI